MTKLQRSGVARMSRRDALTRVAGAGLGIASILRSGASVANAQAGVPPALPVAANGNFAKPPSWKTELRQLAPNVYAYVQAGGPGQGNGAGISNAGVIVGPDHVMVIDTLAAPLHTKALMAAARNAAGNKPFGRVVNTHHHGDHTAGNQFFVPAEIVSHPFCRQEVLKLTAPPVWEKREGWAVGDEPRKIVAPSTCFTDKATYYYGDTVVELIHLGIAHTWGDIIVYLPQSKVLFAGDVAFHYVVPFSHAGHVTNWLQVIDKVMAMDVETIVPGHGPIGGKKELGEMAEYYRVLKVEAKKRFDAGMSPGKAAADIKLGKFDNWIGTERIVLNTFRLYNEFTSTLTPYIDQTGIARAVDEYNSIVKAASGSRQ